MAEAKETKKDLRKSHFNFGNDKGGAEAFTTTNMERFRKSAVEEAQSWRGSNTNQKGAVNIVYGNAKPDYQSTNMEAMVQHDIG